MESSIVFYKVKYTTLKRFKEGTGINKYKNEIIKFLKITKRYKNLFQNGGRKIKLLVHFIKVLKNNIHTLMTILFYELNYDYSNNKENETLFEQIGLKSDFDA